MKTGRTVLLIAVAGLFLFLVWLNAHDEPTYQGKRWSKWFLDLEASAKQRRTAEIAIREIGTNALPLLMRKLQQQDSRAKLRLVDLMRRQSVVRLHFVDENKRLRCVFEAFDALRLLAAPAVPELTLT